MAARLRPYLETSGHAADVGRMRCQSVSTCEHVSNRNLSSLYRGSPQLSQMCRRDERCKRRSNQTRIKSKTIGSFDHTIDAAKILYNLFAQPCRFGLRRHRSTCGLIMNSVLGAESDGPVVGCETPKSLVSSLLKNNPIANRSEHLRHQPSAQKRKRRTENNPAADIDMLVGVFVGFRNVQLTAFQVVKPAFAAH